MVTCKSKSLFIIFIFILTGQLYAEAIAINQYKTKVLDSLHAKINSPGLPDSIIIQNYIEIADILTFESENNYLDKTAEHYFNLAVQFASDKDLLKKLIKEADKTGVKHRNKANNTMAMAWHEMELNLADSLGLIPEKIIALNNLGVVYRRIDDYQQGSNFHLQALKLAEEIEDISGIAIATNGLGNIQYLLGNYNEAMRLFSECLQIEQSRNQLLGVAINLNNIGNVYKMMGNHDKALEYYMLSLEVNREIGSQKGVAICYNDIGDVYRVRKEYDKALNYCLLGLELNQSLNDLNYLANSQIRVAQLFIDKKDYQNALKYIGNSIEVSILAQSKANMKDAYDLMYIVYKRLNQPALALRYLELAGQLNDSILGDETRKSIMQMQALFDRERSENQITILKKQKEISELSSKRQKFISLITGIILIGVLAAFVVVIYIFRMKTVANKLLRTKNQEIELARADLKVYADQMEIAKEEAVKSNLLKSQFLANMSHEIRTPMNSVIGFSDILAMIITDPKQLIYVESIRSSGKNLLTLINDILDLSKIEAGKMVVDKGPTRLQNLFGEIRNIFSVQILEKNNRFILNIQDELPEVVFLSEIRLRQILFNLVGNAMKFTNNGEVSLSVSLEKYPDESEFNLHFIISDNGIGIRYANIDHIFEAFYQESGISDSNSGTGLGLTITKRLIEAMNGEISVESEFGKGTVFNIRFNRVNGESHEISKETSLKIDSLVNENPVFFLLLSKEKTEDDLVSLLKNFEIRLHSFYSINKLVNLLEYTEPDCIFIELDGFKEDDFIQFVKNKIPKSSKIILLGTINNQPIQSYFAKFQRFNLPEMNRALLKFVKSIASIRGYNIDYESAIPLQINTATRETVNQLIEKWKNARSTQFMNDTDAFADSVLDFASTLNNTALIEFANDLKNFVSAFDIENINAEMNDFEQILSQQGFLE
jgi:signal transduction histidine kinase